MNQLTIKPNSNFSAEKNIKIKNTDLGSEDKKACYRGFDSIDQEMERRIALQWFSTSRSGLLHGQITLKGHL